MSFIAFTLLIISALIHALWNLLGKRERRPSKEFFFLANLFGCILFIPSLLFSGLSLHGCSTSLWLWIILTGLFEAIYFAAVAKSYHYGDISVAYPISRSLPIILVMLVGIFLQHSFMPNLYFVLGSGLVVIGCIITAIKHFGDFKPKSYLNHSCRFAYLAAFASAGYLIADDNALHLLKSAGFANIFLATLLYSFIRGISICCWMGGSIMLKQNDRRHLVSILRENKWPSIIAGASMYLSYTLVLLSMYLVKNLSYIALFRQLSIPVTVIAGIYFFKEKTYLTKIFGIIMILSGLLLVAFT